MEAMTWGNSTDQKQASLHSQYTPFQPGNLANRVQADRCAHQLCTMAESQGHLLIPGQGSSLSVALGEHKDGTWEGSGEEGGCHTFLGFLHDLLYSFPPNELPLEADLAFLILQQPPMGCESWTIKKVEHRRIHAFELWCWRKLKSPLESKEIKPVNPKGNQP